MKKLAVLLSVLILIFAVSAKAEQAHSGVGQVVSVAQDTMSPRGNVIFQAAAYQFVPIDSTMTYSYSSNMRYKTNIGAPYLFAAGMNIPSGSKIAGIELYGCDTNAATGDAGDISVWLVDCPGGLCTWYGGDVTNGEPGCGWYYYDLNPANLTVDKSFRNYHIEVRLSTADNTNEFQAVNVYYSLQVMPAPGVATFGDVPTSHWAFQYIEALAASGITAGCGSGNYCPMRPITRGEMAVFLSSALGLYWLY